MSDYNLNDLGRDISNLVQNAVESQDFSKLNDTIQKAVNETMKDTANGMLQGMDNFGDEWNKVVDMMMKRSIDRRPDYMKNRTHQAAPAQNPWKTNREFERKSSEHFKMKDIPNDELFSTGGVSRGSGYLQVILGILGIICCFSGLLSVSIVGAVTSIGFTAAKVLLGAGALGSGVLTWNGLRILKKLKHFKNYIKVVKKDKNATVKELAGAVGQSEKATLKELENMIGDNMFLQGHIDPEKKKLFVTDEAYESYIKELQQFEREKAEKEAQRMLNFEREQEEKRRKEQETAGIPEEVKRLIEDGNFYIGKIHSCNDAIQDEEVSRKLDDLELITRKIFEYVSKNPESAKETKKLMKYYLPTTIKLLESYQQLNDQPKQTENIVKSKRDIENTLDTLNQAFAQLFDKLYQDTSMDISADISVLNTMLAQEGLTGQEMGSH